MRVADADSTGVMAGWGGAEGPPRGRGGLGSSFNMCLSDMAADAGDDDGGGGGGCGGRGGEDEGCSYVLLRVRAEL